MIAPAYPAFNIYSRVAGQTTALGPLSVATVVSRIPGWDVEVIDENNYRRHGPRGGDGLPDHRTLQTIRHADLVGLYGGLSSTVPRLLELARLYRDMGVMTIAGGQHFVEGNLREALEAGVDFVVLGEGEHAISDLIDVAAMGARPDDVPGIAFLREGRVVITAERPPITDFEVLPLPDFSLLRYARVKLFPVSWIRGCGMNCEFCTVKGRPRASAAERVMEQVASLLEVHDARRFFIVDDMFGHHRRDETLRLCRMLEEYQRAVSVRLDINVQIRLDRGSDGELLSAMRNAGVNTVCIGYESPIPQELEAMNKGIRPGDMQEMTDRFHRAGFRVHGMFIFGYPLPSGEEFSMCVSERVKLFRSFIRRSRIDTIQVLLPVPVPGTELFRRLDSEGRLLPLDCIGWEYYDGNFPLFLPDPPLTPESMHLAIRRIMGRFYRFSRLFAVLRNILVFPAMVFPMRNLRYRWCRWHRMWKNTLLRFGGWMISRKWRRHFRRSAFLRKLARAKQEVPSGD